MLEQKDLLIIYDTKESLKIAKEFCYLRENTKIIQEKIENREILASLAIRKKTKLYFAIQQRKSGLEILIGRLFGEEEIDFMKLKVTSFKGVKEFTASSPECSMAFLSVYKNLSEREQNLFTDIFNIKRKEICTDYLKYYLVISKENNTISIKLFRNGTPASEIGPFFSLEVKESFFCEEDLFLTSLDLQKVKKKKNVKLNNFKDKVGRIYVEEENYKDIKFKRARAYKEFAKENK